ncbi:hypothetical protein PFISCL1PPCAC_23678 [Pristionchus fissidentatus]|uniref:ER lumen protein-retaining receptor n=1 Tax=Pristionchus fissidentatus TaxID=1538716 RepID=A0AAV5WK74_9BILA|nr:hypothetical protein PFISCL1PPCAC_23678 [Pristionchus fissidentatus]
MNIFRLLGDLSHLAAILILLWKMWASRSVSGISARSQILYFIVFVTRYLDLFTTFISAYNSLMKLFFLSSTAFTIYLMLVKFRPTYERDSDSFRIEFLLLPTACLALIANHNFDTTEILWTFSIYLEAVAIFPQLYMLQKTGSAETITAHYLFALGIYRALYIFNWVLRYYQEDFFDPIATLAGIVQTILYADFFYVYFTRVVSARKNMELPI